MIRTLAALVLSTLVLAPAAPAAAWDGTVEEAVRALPVAVEVRDGYDRDLFEHWVDLDGDGCDTRDEVLIAEARTAPSVGTGCTLSGGSWRSSYDGVATSDPSTFDIDHLVPLAEAWDSGASAWTEGTRRRFANDLADPRSLRAVTAGSNRSKGDRDPAEWLPERRVCRYVREYVATKLRWRLRTDRAERRALLTLVSGCPDRTLHVRRARVVVD